MYPDKLIFVRLFQLVDNDRINFFDVGLRDYGTAGLIKTKLVVWTASFLAVTQSDDGTAGLRDYGIEGLIKTKLVVWTASFLAVTQSDDETARLRTHSAFLIQHSSFSIPHSAFT